MTARSMYARRAASVSIPAARHWRMTVARCIPSSVAASATRSSPRAMRRPFSSFRWESLELRKAVANHVPRRLGADKDVGCRGDRRRIDQGAEGDMHIDAVSNKRIEEGAALTAAGVIYIAIA
jgi:hypothetical protein